MPNFAWAAPSISGTNGSFVHDQSVTIFGGGFGTKSPVAPLMWDAVDGMYSGLTNGDRIPVGGLNPWPEGYGGVAPYYKTLNARGKWTAKYSNNPTSNHNAAVFEKGAVGGKYFPEVGSGTMYVTWWNWVGLNGALNNSQNKFVRFTPYGTWDTSWAIWSPGFSHGGNFPGTYTVAGYHNEGVIRGEWNRMESIIDNAFSPYHPRLLWSVNNEMILDCYSGKTGCTSGGASLGSTENINGMSGFGWMPEFDFTPDCATVDFGEVYVDKTQSRVEVCNANTKAASTHCEIQIPHTTWSDGQLQITVNQGSFADSSNQYLYVIDSSGDANVNGYSINFSAVNDITSPANPSELNVI